MTRYTPEELEAVALTASEEKAVAFNYEESDGFDPSKDDSPTYNWLALHSAATSAGIDPKDLEDWVFKNSARLEMALCVGRVIEWYLEGAAERERYAAVTAYLGTK